MSLPFTIYLALAAPASDLETKVQTIFEDNCTACHGDGGEWPPSVAKWQIVLRYVAKLTGV